MNVIKMCSIIGVSILFLSCTKEPGEGGKATLKGSLVGTYYCDENGSVLAENIAVPDERVYISYGSNGEIDDDVRTSSNGSFKFEFLQPGQYSIHTYSECAACPTGLIEQVQEVEIGKKDDEVILDDIAIEIYTGRGCNTDAGPGEGGNKVIRGSLTGIYINEDDYDTLGVKGQADTRVYIIYGSGTQQNDDVRTSLDGSFEFTELKAGSYQVYAMSECRTLQCPSGEEAVLKNITIAETDSIVNIGDIQVIDFRNP